jgi:hypothetical protein
MTLLQRDNMDRSSDDASKNALTQMIIKLRGMGLDNEAKQLEFKARRLPAEQRCGVSFGPFSTD